MHSPCCHHGLVKGVTNPKGGKKSIIQSKILDLNEGFTIFFMVCSPSQPDQMGSWEGGNFSLGPTEARDGQKAKLFANNAGAAVSGACLAVTHCLKRTVHGALNNR